MKRDQHVIAAGVDLLSQPRQQVSAPLGEVGDPWRESARVSQLDLALEAGVSARHLSFVETGRARPSRDMILQLTERLGVPLRERNVFLLAAGHAPIFPKRPLDDPALAQARMAVELVLAGQEPYPALAVDRHWNLVTANRALPPLMVGAAAELLEPPVNVLRLSLHAPAPAPLAQVLSNGMGREVHDRSVARHGADYLFFDGRCEEAIAFYKEAVGAEVLMMMRFGDSPEPPPPGAVPPGAEGKVMHACLRIGETEVMASDGGCNAGARGFQGFSLSLSVADEAEADRVFAALAEGGEVRMPLGRTFFSPRFGMLTDRFGLGWTIIVPA